ncbi:MAG: DUF5677 domain-containing protein [Methanoculleus sp.]|nr:DUF5677 domain-containing protein [Methanoculleus sp.]
MKKIDPLKISNSRSSLSRHKRNGKLLVPPFCQIPNIHLMSWVNDRLPEMLWAILIISNLKRPDALSFFRKTAHYFSDLVEGDQPADLTLTTLGKLDGSLLEGFIESICADKRIRNTLSPMLLLDSLPGKKIWEERITSNISDSERWQALQYSVYCCYDHQSQESTDCRWVRVYYQILRNKLHFPTPEYVKEILLYPRYGDMRAVRPTIRAAEGVITSLVESEKNPFDSWSTDFWKECLKKTSCIGLPALRQDGEETMSPSAASIGELIEQLSAHCERSRSTTGIDAEFDTTFGIALYCLRIYYEVLDKGTSTTIISRMALRGIVECYITLKYLVENNNPDLWLTYRTYGTSQAKLALLKYEEMGCHPECVDYDLLKMNANQDVSQEFTTINLGNWEKTNLRVMSDKAGVKSEYDSYYNWSSGYIHGTWSAINESVYDICVNPLHRFHKIPKNGSIELKSIDQDAISLLNKILDVVDLKYPSFSQRIV